MSKKQWVEYAQQTLTHDLTEAEALAEWKKMQDDSDLFERAEKGRKGELRIWCPTREVKSLTRAREESYEINQQTKARKMKESDLEDMRDNLHNRSGFSSVCGEEWKTYTGGQAATANSSIVNASGFTATGSNKHTNKVKTLPELVSTFCEDAEMAAIAPATPSSGQTGLVPQSSGADGKDNKKNKNFDPVVWKALEGPKLWSALQLLGAECED